MAFRICLAVILFLFVGCDEDSGDTTGSSKTGPPQPTGAIYFMLTSPSEIIKLDIVTESFSSAVPESLGPVCFAVSGDGQILGYIKTDGTLACLNLQNKRTQIFKPDPKPTNYLSFNNNGSIAAYHASIEDQPAIAIYYTEANLALPLTQDIAQRPRFPNFSRTQNIIAWTQNDGLFFDDAYGSQSSKLISSPITVDHFSPSAFYLAAGGYIFDLVNKTPLPFNHYGTIRFISEQEVCVRTFNKTKIYKSKLSGSGQKDFAGSVANVAGFELSGDGRFACLIKNVNQTLTFAFYDLQLLSHVKDIVYIQVGSRTLASISWPFRSSIKDAE